VASTWTLRTMIMPLTALQMKNTAKLSVRLIGALVRQSHSCV
jgi:hypothetical protein